MALNSIRRDVILRSNFKHFLVWKNENNFDNFIYLKEKIHLCSNDKANNTPRTSPRDGLTPVNFGLLILINSLQEGV